MFDDTDLPPLLQNAPDSTEFRKLRKRIIRETRAAIDQYGMIEPGARWLVCLSGGQGQLHAARGPRGASMARAVAG